MTAVCAGACVDERRELLVRWQDRKARTAVSAGVTDIHSAVNEARSVSLIGVEGDSTASAARDPEKSQ